MREVRVPRVTRQRAAQQLQRLSCRHAATRLVGERDDAVDVRVSSSGSYPVNGLRLKASATSLPWACSSRM